MPSTLNEFLEKALKDQPKVDEASHPALISIADMFARYLLGDKNIAVSQLKQAGQVKTQGLANMDASEYNALYNKMHSDLFQVIRKNMKSVM